MEQEKKNSSVCTLLKVSVLLRYDYFKQSARLCFFFFTLPWFDFITLTPDTNEKTESEQVKSFGRAYFFGGGWGRENAYNSVCIFNPFIYVCLCWLKRVNGLADEKWLGAPDNHEQVKWFFFFKYYIFYVSLIFICVMLDNQKQRKKRH